MHGTYYMYVSVTVHSATEMLQHVHVCTHSLLCYRRYRLSSWSSASCCRRTRSPTWRTATTSRCCACSWRRSWCTPTWRGSTSRSTSWPPSRPSHTGRAVGGAKLHSEVSGRVQVTLGGQWAGRGQVTLGGQWAGRGREDQGQRKAGAGLARC